MSGRRSALESETGMLTSPKAMDPFQMERDISEARKRANAKVALHVKLKPSNWSANRKIGQFKATTSKRASLASSVPLMNEKCSRRVAG